jgi:hypothetical protein
MTITADQFKDAARKAVAAGDIATARKLIARAQAAETQAAPAQGGQAAPNMAMPDNAVLQSAGPGPTRRVDPALYDMGAIGRRFVEGEAPRPAQSVTAGDGTEMVLNPQTGQYTSRELMANNMRPGMGAAIGAGALQGMTVGTGDEIMGALAGPFKREQIRAATDASRRDRPVATMAGEIGGAVTGPVRLAGPTGTLREAVTTGAKVGAAYGGGYAAADASGGVLNRLQAGAEGAVAGAVFGAGAAVAVNFGSKAFRSIFKASAQRPTIENLRAAKSAAYNAVDSAGERFSGAETAKLADDVKAALAQTNYVAGVDRQTDAVVTLLDRKAGQELTLGQLDKLRQDFFKRVSAAKNETGIYDAIDAIDGLILNRTSTSELLDAARLANARYKKAELLDRAFQKARDQTASTGSGGNILNKYRQAVTSIVNDPKRAKWFAPPEIEAMRAFITGTPSQNVLRLVGKLSPGGNGLMTALNLGAVSANPAMLGVTAVASGAKAIADGATERGVQGLIGRVAGSGTPTPRGPIQYPQSVNRLAAPFAGEYAR